jgi:hypothetical protein
MQPRESSGGTMRAHACIDGFNLYFGIKRWPAYKWLNLEALLDRVFPKDDIRVIRYFTARVKGSIDPGAPIRQNAYLRALGTLPRVVTHFGKFNINKTWLPLNMPPDGRFRFCGQKRKVRMSTSPRTY